MGEVIVRISLYADQHRRLFHHQGRHVRVTVERDHQRHLIADRCADSAQQVAFAVIQPITRRRAMHLQENAVEWTSPANRGEQLLLRPFVCVVGDLAGQTRKDELKRRDFPSAVARRLGKAAKRAVTLGQPQDGVTPEHRTLKAFEPDPLSRKGVGCDEITADPNSHNDLLSRTRALR